jgi:hypothetical protein
LENPAQNSVLDDSTKIMISMPLKSNDIMLSP